MSKEGKQLILNYGIGIAALMLLYILEPFPVDYTRTLNGFVLAAVALLSYKAWQQWLTLKAKEKGEFVLDGTVVAQSHRAQLIDTMTSRGYRIDKDGDGYIQFKKDKGSALGSIVICLIGIIMLFVFAPIGVVILVYWFVSLFLSGRGEVKTFTLSS